MHPLDGSFLKLQRANEHLKALDDLIKGLLKRNPYKIIQEVVGKGQASEYVLRFKQLVDIPPDISLLIGDICSNLRSALDYLLWQLWLLKIPSFNDVVYFPIFDTEPKWNDGSPNSIGPREVGGIKGIKHSLPDRQRAMIETLQPYKTGNRALSILRDLNTPDKHRRIQVIRVMPDVRKISITVDQSKSSLYFPLPIQMAFQKIPWIPVKDGTIVRIPLNRFAHNGTSVNLQSDINFRFAFEGSRTANGQLIETSIKSMISEVNHAIMLLEPEFSHLGTSSFK